jgi:SAM-dependent methyltransferase
VSESRWPERNSLRRLPEFPPADALTTDSALKPLGIQYHAPYDGVLANQPDSFGAVFCTQVLQHIPKPVQLAIFKELHQCLRPGGLFFATVHLVGQFRSPHLPTGQYEHLKHSPWYWENVVNSSLMGFNRLKSPDYRETLEQAGFRIRTFDVQWPTAADLAELKRTRIHPAFHRYSEQELAARHLFFVAEKP